MSLHDIFVVIEVLSGIVLHGAVVVSILLTQRRQPTATLAWILTVTLVPFLGIVLYLVIGRTKTLRLVRRSRAVARRLEDVFHRCGAITWGPLDGAEHEEPRTIELLRLGENLGAARASRRNRVELLQNGPATYRAIIEAVTRAEKQIHVEFYIIQPDKTGESMRDRLSEAARRGIEVRVLYDDVGSSSLPSDFWKPLVDAGGRVAPFNPVSAFTSELRRRDRVDFRNHRKIVVVDGRVGFTGGINVGREYLGLDPEIGFWRDTHLKIEGPAVLSLQEVFALDWLSAADERGPFEPWFPQPDHARQGSSLAQIVESGPDSEWAPVEQIYFYSIAHARKRVWLATPYFVPSPAIETVLVNAAMRGVDVRLLLPDKADSLLVGLASRSYFAELLRAGVKIHLYERGFLHAKTMVVDSWMGTVGSANMDMRSFRLNFELNAFVVDAEFADEMARQFQLDLEHAREFTIAAERAVRLPKRLAQQTARLLSPLL